MANLTKCIEINMDVVHVTSFHMWGILLEQIQ